jgi:hypothetical protein
MEVEDAMLDNVDGVGDELPVEEELLVAKERLEVSMAKLTRDWKNTT